jgi:hypothetical protein
VDTRESSPQSFTPVTWPLIGSLILTTIVVAIVCVPPFSGLHSWGHLVWLACVYMLTAACVHALAVWSIYRIQRVGVREWTLVWPVVWGAWIAVVWLPLVALLTYERSQWVAAIVPLAAVFLTMFLVSRRRSEEDEFGFVVERKPAPSVLWMDESPRLWKVLLPSLLIAVVVDGGAALYATNHAWMAGALFAVAAAYFADRLLSRTAAQVKVHQGSVRRGAAGNSVTVWMLTVMALLPFLAGMGVAMRGVMGMPAVQAAHHVANAVHRAMRGYTGIILTRPRNPHEILTPVLTANPEGFKKQDKIPFDGQYWYYQWPDSRPGVDAHVVQGEPTKSRIKSTDNYPIMMEAHQRLAKPMAASCCRALQLNVVNAEAVPGKITLEVQLRDEHGYVASLGNKVLVSSTVSPMPLHRGPVEETLEFQIPRGAKGKRFGEITVRVKPESSRAPAAPEVGIESFAFQR